MKFKVFLGDSEVGKLDFDGTIPIQPGLHYGENKAIPIEWIINWLTRQTIPALHTCDEYEAVSMMLDDWEKENETD